MSEEPTSAAKRFDGRSAIVTGGASGIGAATVERLVDEGARVVVFDRDEAAARAIAERAGPMVRWVAGHITDPHAMDRAVSMALESGARIDVLVTAAGVSLGGHLVDTPDERWDEVFDINVKGTFVWMRAVVPHMVRAGTGAVVTVASQLAFAGGQGNAAYIASKGAVVSLTRTAACEHATDGVRINSVAPGATETPMFARSMARGGDPQGSRKRSRERHAMRRFGRPEEIAAAIAYLASDEASFTTGVVLPVDGGWLAA